MQLAAEGHRQEATAMRSELVRLKQLTDDLKTQIEDERRISDMKKATSPRKPLKPEEMKLIIDAAMSRETPGCFCDTSFQEIDRLKWQLQQARTTIQSLRKKNQSLFNENTTAKTNTNNLASIFLDCVKTVS
jgi:hypothetical protein